MSMPDEGRIGAIVHKTLMEIMDLRADIDPLLRDGRLTSFGSMKWQYASLDALQRLVGMTAIQFVLSEPEGRLKGNDEFEVAMAK